MRWARKRAQKVDTCGEGRKRIKRSFLSLAAFVRSSCRSEAARRQRDSPGNTDGSTAENSRPSTASTLRWRELCRFGVLRCD